MPVDYVSGLGQLPDPLKALQDAVSFKVGLQSEQLRQQTAQAKLASDAREIGRQQQYQAAMTAYARNPNAENLSVIMGAFPEYHETTKTAHAALDKSKRGAAVTTLGEITALAARSNYKGAADLLRKQIEADRAAGTPDEQDERVLEALESDDPEEQKQALAVLTVALGTEVGPEHANSFLKSVGLSGEPDLVMEDGILVDKRTRQAVWESPYMQVSNGPGGIYGQERLGVDAINGGGRSTQGRQIDAPQQPTPLAAERVGPVASVLSSRFPAHVVAGFLGNFDVEGGYGGARGDGGRALGIAQWHPGRRANYQRAIGRPFDPADHEGQARFVVWEMENPEAAGMTVAQRDAILSAKTPQQAAALIDRYYERSSGQHRQERIKAAGKYAGAIAPPIQISSTQEYNKLPSGARYIAPGESKVRIKQ